MNAPTQPPAPSTTEVLAATIAAAVERQLTQYVSAMAQQVEASRRAAEQGKAELRAEFQQQLDELAAKLAGDQSARLDELAAKLAGDQSARLAAVEASIEQRLMEVPVGSSAFDAEELAMLREQIDSQSAAAHARIDELHKATRRFDEQASALVQHVNDTTIALAQRMDEGNRALATAVEERLALVRTTLEAVGPEVQRQLAEQVTTVNGRLEFIEHRVTDRMLTMEERINEQSGEKIAHLEATIGRIGAGFDDAIGAMSHRLLGVENSLEEALLKIAALQEQIGKVDESAINEVKDAMEGMLAPTVKEVVVANAEIRQVFKVSKVGKVAGSYILDGEIPRNSAVRVKRGGEVIAEDKIAALKRFQEDVAEVKTGFECGIHLHNYHDFEVGDILEAYKKERVL